jgi:tetratricopeptide (TPR) repeat protein
MTRLPVVVAFVAGLFAFAVTAVQAQPAPEAAVNADDAAGPIMEAERLLAAGQADQAWRMLEARAVEFAGNPDFDYLLGLAALDSGRPGQAIFALERVLMARPDFLPARAEIARAYFMANERENARREFASVADQKIPEAARRTIGRYLDAIDSAEAATRPQVTALVELEAGYDSNVNFGSSSGQWVLSDGTAVRPLPVSLPRESSMVGAALGLGASGPVAPSIAGSLAGRLEWNLSARAWLRAFERVPEFDQQQLDFSGGLALRRGCHRYTAAALLQHLQLDGEAYRNAAGGVLQWQCETDPRTLVGASLQSFDLDYPGSAVRDARRNAIGVNAARVLETAGRPILLGSVAIGEERARASGFDNLSYGFLSVRAGVVANIAPQWRGSASLAWEGREFDGAEPIFGVIRDDRQTDVRLEFERRVDNRTSLVPLVVYTRNRSSLEANDFRRTQAGIQLRHRF